MFILIKPFSRISKNFLIYFLMMIPVVCISNVTLKAQDNSNSKKKNEIIDQDQKELDKAKKLHVKSRSKYVALYDNNGKIHGRVELGEKVLFDKRGFRKTYIRYKGLGKMDFKYSYNYNSKGDLVEAATYDSKGVMATKRISKYDKKGNELERKMVDFDHQTDTKAVFKYDKDGNIIDTKTYSGKGELLNDLIVTYKNGQIIKAITKNSRGDVTQEVNSVYDSYGRVVKEDRKTDQGTYSINYKYDSRGNLVEISNPEYRRTYEYDGNNDLIEDKMYLPNGARQFRVQFIYYPNGLLKEEIRYTTQDKPAFNGKYEYEFYK